ncbi:MAG: 2-hydroxyacyl-CoA dehydratase, partial [Desulfobacteraceae bacterium]|nr:2-hydroxyacyl-CoA dehydratase [Desulfobacteraceae bacterium]
EERHIDFYISQTKELISFLEKETGKDFDEDRFEKVVELSSDACEYFHKVIELRKNSPSPVGFRQLFADMFGLVNVTGEQETLDFYKAFYEETLEKKENNIGVAEHEEYRLIWDNLPIYHDMDLFDYFESKGMVFVYETLLKEYFAKGLDKSDPFRGLAKKYLTGWTNRRLDRKIEIVEEAVKEYRVDGIVVFENKGCRGYSTGQLDVAKSLKEKIGIPNMIVEGSMADPGSHDPNKFRSMVDMFHEVLKSQSAGGR